MSIIAAVIILLAALGVVFVVGIWFSRHHAHRISAELGALHEKLNAIHNTVARIKRV